MEEDPCRGVVYLTVLYDHPYLVSLLSSILLSLHLFFITCANTDGEGLGDLHGLVWYVM